MNPKRIVQLIPAVGWRVRIDSGFEDVVAFGLTRDGRVVSLVVAEDGKSIVESSDRDFSLIGPVSFEMLDRAAVCKTESTDAYDETIPEAPHVKITD